MMSYRFWETYLETKAGTKRALFLHKNYIIFAPELIEGKMNDMKINVTYATEKIQAKLLEEEKYSVVTGDNNLQVLDDFLEQYELHQIH